jgi:hypothetical protein
MPKTRRLEKALRSRASGRTKEPTAGHTPVHFLYKSIEGDPWRTAHVKRRHLMCEALFQ